MSKEVFKYVAERKMRMVSSRGNTCSIATMWKNEVITIYFNTSTMKILSVASLQNIDQDSLLILRNIIIRFLA